MPAVSEFRQIDWSSAEYLQELDLRNRILRIPLGRNLMDENLDNEKADFHLGAFAEDRLVGVLILTPVSGIILKMRQVAIDSDVQGKGIGQQLVRYSETFASHLGYRKIQLHARQTAVSFYLKLNYQLVGEEFMEVGLPHRKMEKDLVAV